MGRVEVLPEIRSDCPHSNYAITPMTELLKEAWSRLQTLPDDQQDELAHRILLRIDEEQRKETALLADLDDGLADLDGGRVVEWNIDVFLREAERRNAKP